MEDGYYWVKFKDGEKCIGLLCTNRKVGFQIKTVWYVAGDDGYYDSDELEAISPRLEPPASSVGRVRGGGGTRLGL